MTSQTVDRPYKKFKNKGTADLAVKLTNWAAGTLRSLKPGKQSDKFSGILKKIVQNPTDIADQLFHAVVSKNVEKDEPETDNFSFDYWIQQAIK